MSKKILVVDDDLYIRELYEEVLLSAGYEVKTAIDGQDALNILKEGGFDLVLLDMMMPKIDGLGVINELTKNPSQVKNGPIILLSNLDSKPVIDEATQGGVVRYLVKADITPDQLLASIKKYI